MATPKIVKVFSHPRSGTRFFQTLLKANFYQNVDTWRKGGRAGHWANRQVVGASPVSKLWGDHGPWREKYGKCFYVYRDGRDVALSFWRSKMMQHPDWHRLSLSEYLRRPLDWKWTPGGQSKSEMTIAEHWRMHLGRWKKKPGVCYVRYEDLVLNTEGEIRRIARFLNVKISKVHSVNKLVGHSPNEGLVGAWRRHFTDADLNFFLSHVERSFWGMWDE